MKTTIKVTNEEKFNALVYDVDTSELSQINNGMCEGNLLITLNGQPNMDVDGQHGANDYQNEFGFILISNEQA